MFIDYYKTLNIDKDVSSDIIKRAYRKLALKFHRDVCKLTDANNRFIEIQEAYEILGDLSKRHFYDILYESYYKPKEKTKSEQIFETRINNDYQKWKHAANKTAVDLAKERFSIAREKIFDNVGQAVGDTINFLSYCYVAFFLIGPFIGLYTSYNSIDVWDTDKNGNAIAGFVICSILSILILWGGVLYIRNKIRE